MSERYLRLFSLPQNIGQAGSPVLISAGALLKDNSTGKVLVQLKFRNISEKSIKSVKIKVNAYDTAGCELKGIDAFSYLDLALGRDKEFGNQTPIMLPDKTTRAFSVEILSVAFMDGTAYIPSIHVAADTLDSDTLETVHLLDDERKELKEKQLAIQEEQYRKLSSLPLIMVVCAVLLLITDQIWRHGLVWEWVPLFFKKWLLALVVPCLCMISCQKIKRRTTSLIKFAALVAIVFLIIQIAATFYQLCYSFSFYNYRLGDFLFNYISASELLNNILRLDCLFSNFGVFCRFLFRTLVDVLFLLKNAFAAVILYRTAKITKS